MYDRYITVYNAETMKPRNTCQKRPESHNRTGLLCIWFYASEHVA